MKTLTPVEVHCFNLHLPKNQAFRLPNRIPDSLACASCLCFLYTDRMAGAFNTGEAIAYFLTWTTYGSWLPGDERGWNRKGDHENLPANPLFEQMALASLDEDPFLLRQAGQQIVEATIRKHCEIRVWNLHAVNARSNHVHVVVTSPGYQPKTVAIQFKAWATKRLQQIDPQRTKFWTQGASCRWINTDDDLVSAVEYTIEAQDRKGAE